MGFPHPTIDIPGHWPDIAGELEAIHVDSEFARQLRDGVANIGDVIAGHVCATTWIFSPTASHTLLVQHRTLGWSTPGGHVEVHETSRVGGLRELEEETGLTRFDVRPVLTGPAGVHVTDRDGDQPHRHWNIAWLYVADMDAPLSKVEGARWFDCDDLPAGPADLFELVAQLRPLIISA